MLKIIKLVPHLRGDADAVPVGVPEALLEETEEAPAAGNANGHTPELAEDLVPELDRHTGLAAEGLEDVLQALDPVWGTG